MELADGAREIVDRRGQKSQRPEKGDQFAGRHDVAQHLAASQPEDQSERHNEKDLDGAVQSRVDLDALNDDVKILPVAFFETGKFQLLRRKSPHDANRRKRFLGYRRKFGDTLLHMAPNPAEDFRSALQHENDDRQDQKRIEHQLPVQIEAIGKHRRARDALNDKIHSHVRDGHLQHVGVVGDSRQKLAHALVVDELQRQSLQMSVSGDPHIHDDLLPDPAHQILLAVSKRRLENKEYDERDDQHVQHRVILADQHAVDDVLHQPGRDRRAEPGADHTDKSASQFCPVRQKECQQSTIERLTSFLFHDRLPSFRECCKSSPERRERPRRQARADVPSAS